jgi:hypothetical protein
MTADRLTTQGSGPAAAGPSRVEIRREDRRLPDGPWEPAFRLWADHVVVHGRDLLARRGLVVERVVASGPRATLETGVGEDVTRVWGARFELDVVTSIATLEGGPDRPLRIQRGPQASPQAVSEQTRVVIDLTTGWLRSWEHPRVILRGAGG